MLTGAANRPCQPAEDDLGLDVWPATDVLCQYMSAHPDLVRSPARVLELGSGKPQATLTSAVMAERTCMDQVACRSGRGRHLGLGTGSGKRHLDGSWSSGGHQCKVC